MSETVNSSVRPRLNGLTAILAATVLSGIASYVITWLVPRSIGISDYAVFAIFWAFVYLVVGALFGIQQEITRGTRPVVEGSPIQLNRARNFGLGAAAIVLVVVIGSAPFWVNAIFPVQGWLLVWPLAIGTASFVLVATLCGTLYGLSQWTPLAVLMVVDSFLRLALIGTVLLFTSDLVALAWAVVIPFPATVLLVWPFIRGRVIGRAQLGSGYRSIAWNVARTVVAAASNGVMVSGLPLLIGLTSPGVPDVTVGLVVLTATLVRAPLIIVAMSLQSYLIVRFRDETAHFARLFLTLLGVALAGGVVLAAVGWLIGPAVFAFLFPGEPTPEGWFIALLVGSSALVAAVCIGAAAVLSRDQHVFYSLGWLAGAVVTVGALLLPIDFMARIVVALVAGPIIALLVLGLSMLRPAVVPRTS